MCQLGPRRSSRVSARAPAASRRRASRSARRRRTQSAGFVRGWSGSVGSSAGGRWSMAGSALAGAGRAAGRAEKTVTFDLRQKVLGLSFHYGKCPTPYGGKTLEGKERGVSRDECHIHVLRVLAYGASRRLLSPIGRFKEQVSLTFDAAHRCLMI